MSLKYFGNCQGTPTAPRAATASVVTDLQIVTTGNPDYVADWTAAKAAILAANPTVDIGTYISSRRACEDADVALYPRNVLDLDDFTPDQYWPEAPVGEDGEFIDYSQPAAQAELIAYIAGVAADRNQPILYTDNWAHPASGASIPTWSVTMTYMGLLTSAIHLTDTLHFTNVAGAFGAAGITENDITALAANCDGVTLELALHENVAEDETALAHAVACYQILIDAGTMVGFIVTGLTENTPEYIAEARFQAGLAMVLWGPKVAWPWFRDDPDWVLWPETYGAPTGALVQDGTTLAREFGNYYFTVDCAARTVMIGDAVADIRNTIADRLWVLFEAQATITAAVLPGNRYKGNESGWLRREIARAPADRRGMEITFARGRHSLYTGRTGFAKEISGFTTSSGCDFHVTRFHEAVITLREQLPNDPGDHAVQEAIEQTIFNAEPQLGLASLIPPDGLGELTSEERETRLGEFPRPGRITTWRLPITTVQSALALRAITV